MNHFHTRRTFPRWLITLMIFVLIIVVFAVGTSSVSSRNLSRQKETLENALTRDITDYYAANGRYPESLEVIEETYGLTYDTSHLFVDYRVNGANLRPVYVVLERTGS